MLKKFSFTIRKLYSAKTMTPEYTDVKKQNNRFGRKERQNKKHPKSAVEIPHLIKYIRVYMCGEGNNPLEQL